MKSISYYRTLMFVAFFAIHPCFSQTPNAGNKSGRAEEFNSAARQHKDELRRLMKMRGATVRNFDNVSVDGLKSALSAYKIGVGVLFYHIAHDTLQTWLIDAGGIREYVVQPGANRALDSLLPFLRRKMGIETGQRSRAPHLRGVETEQPVEEGGGDQPLDLLVGEITRIVLPPAFVPSLRMYKHIIIVPAGGIGVIPFAMLTPFEHNGLLIDTLSYSISPSLFDLHTVMVENNDRGGNVRESLSFTFDRPLIIGNPDLSHSDVWEFPPLPGAEAEARAVATLAKGKPLIGIQATKQIVLDRLEKADFVYFATHAVADPADPVEKSFIALSGDRTVSFLTAKEIQSMHLTADLAVLSACQTGLGKPVDAGVMGLARAFQIAGVKEVVMSLWSVNDEATSELMQLFIKRLQEPQKFLPADALRRAMLDMKQRRPNPMEWAAFVVFGVPL